MVDWIGLKLLILRTDNLLIKLGLILWYFIHLFLSYFLLLGISPFDGLLVWSAFDICTLIYYFLLE